jgi:hypothetical protein
MPRNSLTVPDGEVVPVKVPWSSRMAGPAEASRIAGRTIEAAEAWSTKGSRANTAVTAIAGRKLKEATVSIVRTMLSVFVYASQGVSKVG